jgi:Uncharacterized conserved protein (DUF2075)
MRLGPWYGDGEESHRSCRHLRECVTEFGAQGLELDGVLLAWGTDLIVSPIGRFVAGRPPREDWTIVESKLRRRKGDYLGAGLVILPTE